MALQEYREKRNFNRTPEPRGARARPRKQRRFVIQKHHASRLHYDFRLELGGVLKSWAAPKGPSLDPADKRLAVQTEDHPLEYADFEGVIPKGEYGGGAVLLWDRGTWTSEDDDPQAALRKGRLSFKLNGEKLHGRWTLTRLPNRESDGGRHNWLLIKRSDDNARPGGGHALLQERPESVATGRSLEQIAQDRDAVWSSRRNGNPNDRKRKRPASNAPTAADLPDDQPDPLSAPHAKKAPFPRALRPQLCTLVDAAPEGDDWIHEIKFDGYRLLALRHGDRVRLLTRAGHDWTKRFPPITDALRQLPVDNCIIDGEAAILDSRGRTSFQALQGAVKQAKFKNLAYFAFDLLHLNGFDLTRSPLIERKKLLHQLVPESAGGVLRYSQHVVGRGGAVHENACDLSLEGIVSKRADAPYEQRRSKTWLKIRCSKRQEFVVIGWSPPSGSREHFGSLLLAAHDPARGLVYTGKVGTGFSARLLSTIYADLKRLERKTCPADVAPGRADARGARWVRPDLVAEVSYTEWTDDGRLRQPSFLGIREDKEADDVNIDDPHPVEEFEAQHGARPPARTKPKAAKNDAIAGVRLTSPDRVMYPEQGATKRALAEYYQAVADHILPHVVGRPLSTVRCPRGRAEKCFFQKHLGDTFSDPVRAITVPEKKGGNAHYIGIDSLAGLISLVQYSVLEIHPWGATGDHPEQPDRLTFDLDPGPGVHFDRLKDAAIRVRDELNRIGLDSYLKTSGGKGLHIVVPIARRADWDQAKAFCAAIARRIAADEPRRYVATLSKEKRKGRIFIDYLRNSRGATSVAPYSTRARPGAPVSMPLRWDELASLTGADTYTIDNAPARLAALNADPWNGFLRKRQQLTPDRIKAVGAAGPR